MFIIIAELSLVELFSSKQTTKWLYWTIVALLIGFVGLRGYDVGFDYGTYENIFKDIGEGNGEGLLIEPAYMLLNLFLYPLGSFSLVLFIMALIAISTKGSFIAKYSEFPLSSLLVYFCIGMLIYDMGQIRFGVAISFMMLSYSSMMQKHKFKMWLFFATAVLFHYSALLTLPVCFVYNYRLSTKRVLLLLLFGMCFYAISINSILSFIAPYTPSHIAGKIQFYTFYTDTYGKPLGVNISLMLRLLIFGLLFYYRKTIETKIQGTNILVNLYLYGVLVYMIFNSNSEFAVRGSAYFKILELMILPIFIMLGKTKWDKVLIWLGVAAYAFYSLSKILFDVEFGLPYHNYTNILFGGWTR